MTAIRGRSQSEATTLRHLTIRLQISLAALAFILVFAQVGSASVTGSISGIVKDPSGAVIPAARVVALNTRTGVRQTTTTDSDGFYSFPELPIGDYTISIESSGFRP